MKSLFNIIEIYLENPSDKDMERVLERESTKNNTVKMYEKIKSLERQLAEAKENIYKFAEIALMQGEDEFGHSWEDFKFYVLDEQLKEKNNA